MHSLPLFYCDQHEFPLPDGHKFPLAKYRLLRQDLSHDQRFHLEPAPLADRESLLRVHDSAHVGRFLDGTLDRMAMRRIGFPWSPELVRRTLASVGSTMAATRAAVREGFGGTLAGGTHHANRGEGSGFCVFNDLAVAIEMLRSDDRVRRFGIVDLDVHQGDGTAAIFTGDVDVFTLSLHGASNFPFRKQSSRLDVALADGTGDAAYLAALATALETIWLFDPQIIFFQAGVDALATDKLGRLALTHAGMQRRDEMVIGQAAARNLPLVITIGGGYSDPIALTVRAHAQTFRVAADCYLSTAEPARMALPSP